MSKAAIIDIACQVRQKRELKPFGFALLVFPFGDKPKGRMNYISNAQRADMLIAMKEFIARSEGFDVDTPDTKQ